MQRASETSGGGTTIRGVNLLELSRMLGGTAPPFRGLSVPIPVEDDEENDSVYMDEEVEEEEEPYYYTTRYRQAPKQWFAPVTVPQEAGERLLHGGEFGRTEQRLGKDRPAVNVAQFLRNRGARARPLNYKEDVASVRSICIMAGISSYSTCAAPGP